VSCSSQLFIRGANLCDQSFGQRRGDNAAANSGTNARECIDIGRVQAAERRVDIGAQSAMVQKFLECVRGRCESSGHPHACGRQLADHLPERCILSAYLVDVGHSQLI